MTYNKKRGGAGLSLRALAMFQEHQQRCMCHTQVCMTQLYVCRIWLPRAGLHMRLDKGTHHILNEKHTTHRSQQHRPFKSLKHLE